MQEDEFETMMMEDFKKFVLDKLESNYEKLENDNTCFGENAPASCKDLVESLTATVRTQYPRMRQNLTLKKYPSYKINVEHDLNDPKFLNVVERNIKHPYFDTELPRLSDNEAKTAIQSYWKQRGEFIDNHVAKTASGRNNCAVFNENTQATDVNREYRYCRDRFGSVIANGFNKERIEAHTKDYNNQISSLPFLPHMTLGDISNASDAELQANIKQAYQKISDEAGAKLTDMKRWSLDDFKDLFRYQGLVEEYLKEKNPPPRFLCDVVENVHDWHGDGGWWSIAGDVGLGAAALLGGGVCFFTAGLGCALGVAAVSVAADVGRSQININTTIDDFRGGIALGGISSVDDISEAETDRAFALAFAPLSFVGLQAGKGFKPAVRQIASAATRVKTDIGKISRFIARLGSKGKRNLVKAKELFGHTDVSTMIAMISVLPDQLQLQIKQIIDDPNMINSQAFATLLQDARGLMAAQCLERGNL